MPCEEQGIPDAEHGMEQGARAAQGRRAAGGSGDLALSCVRETLRGIQSVLQASHERDLLGGGYDGYDGYDGYRSQERALLDAGPPGTGPPISSPVSPARTHARVPHADSRAPECGGGGGQGGGAPRRPANVDAAVSSTDAGGGQAGGAEAVRVDPRLKLLASGVTVETVMASRRRDGYIGGYDGASPGAGAAAQETTKPGGAAENGGGARGSPGQSRQDVPSVALDGALWTRGGALGPHGDLTLAGPSQESGTSRPRRSRRHEALGPHSDLTLTGDTPRFAALAPAQHRYDGYTHHHDDGLSCGGHRSQGDDAPQQSPAGEVGGLGAPWGGDDDASRAQALREDTHARAPDPVPVHACHAAVDPLLLAAQRSPIAAVAARHALKSRG